MSLITLTAISCHIKSTVFWHITSCNLLKFNRRFGETCSLHLQKKPSKKPGLYVLHAGFLLGLFFDPENRGDMFLRNVCWLSTDYMALYPRRQNDS
jgi:hypothetical protein